MKLKLFILLLMLTGLTFTSCKTNFKAQTYRFNPYIDHSVKDAKDIIRMLSESDRKSIILKNDSVLVYFKHLGGLGSSTAVHYKIVNNELITDSLTCQGHFNPIITNIHFLYSRDSLVNKGTNEKYYNQKYLDKIR